MDEIDTFKLKALDNLSKTITALQTEIDKSQTYVDRVRAQEQQPSIDGSTPSGSTAG
jgi:hypothetical protein